MPIFDFSCQDCGNKFDLMISNRDKDKVKCPECGSSKVRQLLSLLIPLKGEAQRHFLPAVLAVPLQLVEVEEYDSKLPLAAFYNTNLTGDGNPKNKPPIIHYWIGER